MKKLSLVLCLICGLGSAAYAQEAVESIKKTAEVKTFSTYIEGDTGALAANQAVDGLFTGNELEFGFAWMQNFTKAPWLFLHIKGSLQGKIQFNNLNMLPSSDPDYFINPKNKYNGYQSASLGGYYVEMGLYFSKYGYLAVRHNSLTKIHLIYPLSLPMQQTLIFRTEFEFLLFKPGTLINPGDPNFTAKGTQTDSLFKLFAFIIGYRIEFGRGWHYLTELSIRSSGDSFRNGTQPIVWDYDSTAAFAGNLSFRWDNRIGYKWSQGLELWMLLRYQATRLIPNQSVLADRLFEGKTRNNVNIKFGITYSVNFAQLSYTAK